MSTKQGKGSTRQEFRSHQSSLVLHILQENRILSIPDVTASLAHFLPLNSRTDRQTM